MILVIVVGIIVVLFIVVNNIYLKYRLRVFGLSVFLNLEYNYKCIAIGSGPGKFDLCLDEKKKWKNLCVWPEDFRYDYKVLKNYRNHLVKNAVVVHAISPLSFSENIYLKEDKFSSKYVGILPMKEVEISKFKYIEEKYFTILVYPKLFVKAIVCMINCKILKRKNVEKVKYSSQRKNLQSEILDMVQSWIETNPHLKDFKSVKQIDQIRNDIEKNINDLCKIVEFCQKEGLVYVPIIVPMCDNMRQFFSEEFLEEILYNPLDVVGVSEDLIDFLGRDEYKDGKLYTNGLFLNDEGSNLLTKEIEKMLEDRCV